MDPTIPIMQLVILSWTLQDVTQAFCQKAEVWSWDYQSIFFIRY